MEGQCLNHLPNVTQLASGGGGLPPKSDSKAHVPNHHSHQFLLRRYLLFVNSVHQTQLTAKEGITNIYICVYIFSN